MASALFKLWITWFSHQDPFYFIIISTNDLLSLCWSRLSACGFLNHWTVGLGIPVTLQVKVTLSPSLAVKSVLDESSIVGGTKNYTIYLFYNLFSLYCKKEFEDFQQLNLLTFWNWNSFINIFLNKHDRISKREETKLLIIFS